MDNKKSLIFKELKAIIFDLDDTLYDCYNQVFLPAREHALKEMIKSGLEISILDLTKKRDKLSKNHKEEKIWEALVKSFNIKDKKLEKKIIISGQQAYFNYFLIKSPKIRLFPEVKEILIELKKEYKLFLLTVGIPKAQEIKINSLGIRGLFDEIYYQDIKYGIGKQKLMKRIIIDHKIKPQEMIMIGDRRDSDILSANKIGIYSALKKRGKHNSIIKNKYEVADIEFEKFSELRKSLINI